MRGYINYEKNHILFPDLLRPRSGLCRWTALRVPFFWGRGDLPRSFLLFWLFMSLGIFLMNFVIYQGSLFVYLQFVSRVALERNLVFCGIMAGIGMLGGGFSYLVVDRIVMRVLYEQNISYFPLDHRIGRQKTKWIIIPVFMVITTSFLTFFMFLSAILSLPVL
jgi:hypothetical protein